VLALAVGPRLQRPAELLCGLVQLGSVLVVELGTRGQRFRHLDENVGQDPVMQMHHRLASILPRSHQPDGDAVIIGIGIELRMPGKAADIGLVRKSTETSALSLIGCNDMSQSPWIVKRASPTK
jgi:hypothetical protein